MNSSMHSSNVERKYITYLEIFGMNRDKLSFNSHVHELLFVTI